MNPWLTRKGVRIEPLVLCWVA